jgi:lipopolysaccharide/colanic/teichoic acid biosynthesis glycosyltransferase
MLRHRVKTGMTGWAQVHGLRGNTPLDKRIEFDIFYIQNWTFRLDLEIIFRTILKFQFIDRNN